MSPGTLLYALFGCIALALAGASFVQALLPGGPWSKHHRRVVMATALAVPLLFGGAALGAMLGLGPTLLLNAVLPIVCLTAIYSNHGGLHDQRFGVHALCTVTSLWNAFLFVLYSVRAAQLLFQIDLGTEFCSLLTCNALAQSNIGSPDAALLPLWLPLPLLLPPLSGTSRSMLIYASVAGFSASFTLGLHALELPTAYELTTTMRQPVEHATLSVSEMRSLGMSLGDIGELRSKSNSEAERWIGNVPSIEGRIARAHELGLDRVRMSVHLDEELDQDFFARAEELRESLVEAKLKLVLALVPPRRSRTPLPPAQQRKRAEDAQWILSERLRPDLLILFSQPLVGPGSECYGRLPVAHWCAWIQSCARTIRQARPSQRCGIELSPGHPQALALYESLLGEEVELQELHFALDARSYHMPSLQQSLLELDGWLLTRKTSKTLGLLALPPAPLGLGGMQAQVSYVRRFVAFANRYQSFKHLDLGPMWDGPNGWNGYWNARDIERPALAELRSSILQVHAAPR
ncbi:MAG: hypothetical protein CSA62_10685 [Planctomycetota bacterium]|nr:MAG: hypothetical protein CSA62_10685 [Planctomycetota bacterium]